VDSMPGVRFGPCSDHCGGDKGTARGKAECMKKAGIRVAESFSDIVPIVKEYL